MTSKSRSRRTRASFPDDVEPEYDFFSSNETSFEHKTHQLCAQVRQSLALQLESEYSDECLQGLYVESVSPHPNASRLLVVLRHWDHRRPFDLKGILKRLAEVKGRWRSEVASDINRKKAPDLVFQVLGVGVGQ